MAFVRFDSTSSMQKAEEKQQMNEICFVIFIFIVYLRDTHYAKNEKNKRYFIIRNSVLFVFETLKSNCAFPLTEKWPELDQSHLQKFSSLESLWTFSLVKLQGIEWFPVKQKIQNVEAVSFICFEGTHTCI